MHFNLFLLLFKLLYIEESKCGVVVFSSLMTVSRGDWTRAKRKEALRLLPLSILKQYNRTNTSRDGKRATSSFYFKISTQHCIGFARIFIYNFLIFFFGCFHCKFFFFSLFSILISLYIYSIEVDSTFVLKSSYILFNLWALDI